MGDRASTATTFVFLVTLIGVFAALTTFMPSGFYEEASGLRQTQTRDDWLKVSDIGSVNFTDSCNITRPGKEVLNIGDVTVNVWWLPLDVITFEHVWSTWWIFVDMHTFDDMPLTLSDVEAHSPHEGIANVSYMVLTCPCQKTYYTYFVYNSTTYGSWAEAWVGGTLEVYVGMGWTDAIEQQNAWSLIWNIMTFQAPEVFGIGSAATAMNVIIAIPLWASFAIIAAIIILWFIPFLGGE